MKPLEVRLALDTPICVGYMSPTLDGILASAIAATEGESATPALLDGMLASTDGVYRASQAWLDPLPVAFDYAVIRRGLRDQDLRPEWEVFNEVGGRATVKPKLDEVRAILSESVTFFAVGDATAIRNRLAHVGAIGGRRRSGFGRVVSMTVEEVEADAERHGLLMINGQPARALPVEMHTRLAAVSAQAYAVARTGVSFGHTLAPRGVCAVPATFALREALSAPTASSGNSPTSAQMLDPYLHIATYGARPAIPAPEISQYTTPYEQARRFLERSWTNRAADKAARPWAEGDLVVLTEGGSFACTNYLTGNLAARPRTTTESQSATKIALRDLLRNPPGAPSFVLLSERGGMPDSNLILSAGGDRIVICSPSGVGSVSASAMARLFDAIEGRYQEELRDLARAGDALLIGDERKETRKRFDAWGADAVDVYEALPPRWSHAWSVVRSLVPWKSSRIEIEERSAKEST